MAAAGESGVIEHQSKVTGQSSWIFLEPISSADWSLAVVFIKKEIPFSTVATQRRLTWIALAILVFLFSLSAILFRSYRGTTRGIVGAAAAFSILSVAGIAFQWTLATTAASDKSDENVPVFDTAGVETLLADLDEHVKEVHSTELIKVPTGIFIQSIKFTSTNNVIVAGYIWQTYPPDTPDWVKEGFILPEAIESPEITAAFQRKEGTSEVFGWFFRATLRQQFDYSKYPFDREEVSIRLWPKEFGTEVVLVPDLISYSQINPSARPGLEQQDFVLEGWTADGTFFSQRLNTYNTNFGLPGYVGHDGFPELYFNVRLTRNFIDPFVSNLIPIIVVALLLFAALMIATTQTASSGRTGFSTSAVLAYCAALFFVVIVTHIALRNRLAAQEIIYIEFFFIIMHLAILAVSVNAILLVVGDNRFVQYKDNFLPKVLYWPVVLGMLLGITLFAFY